MADEPKHPCLFCGTPTENAGVVMTQPRPAIFPCCRTCELALAAGEPWVLEKLRAAKRESLGEGTMH